MSGATSWHRGRSAEEIVARSYEARGAKRLETRWRGKAGEVDLIFHDDDMLVFIEVKASRDFARAAQALSARQMARLARAAQEYLGGQPRGLDTPARFDIALVDVTGQVEILENQLFD